MANRPFLGIPGGNAQPLVTETPDGVYRTPANLQPKHSLYDTKGKPPGIPGDDPLSSGGECD